MSKFHINIHGVPAPCKATKGNCPRGGSDSHFDTEKEAQVAADKLNESEHGYLPEMNEPFSTKNISSKFPELTDEQVQVLKNYVEKEEEIRSEVDSLKAMKDKASDEYFDRVQEVRNQALEKYESYNNLSVSDEDLNGLIEEKMPKPAPWQRGKGPYQFHPEIDERSLPKVSSVMSAYSGKSNETVVEEINALAKDSNLSLHDASQQYWNTLEQRKDKPFVSLDLETANPKFDKSLEYDNGQLTYIIEVGGIKTYPDGRTEEIDIKYGIPKSFEDRHGTGFQETHNITPDEIRGHAQFTDNKENQKKILDFLDNSVVIAHNAFFEEKQLTNSLRGFKGKMDNGNVEMLDTMNFCKFMVPEAARNTNQAFVEAAGMKYEGAHRAHQDAKMTLNAFNILKDNR